MHLVGILFPHTTFVVTECTALQFIIIIIMHIMFYGRNSMKQNPWEANKPSGSEEIPHLWWKSKVSSQDAVVCRMKSAHILEDPSSFYAY